MRARDLDLLLGLTLRNHVIVRAHWLLFLLSNLGKLVISELNLLWLFDRELRPWLAGLDARALLLLQAPDSLSVPDRFELEMNRAVV